MTTTQDHSACGIGVVADKNPSNPPSRHIVEKALTMLERYVHRGAVAVDGKTGDGAGILTSLPKEFFRKRFGLAVPDAQLGVGMFFLPPDMANPDEAALANENHPWRIILDALEKEGLQPQDWREVPFDVGAIGDVARESMPAIRQLAFTFPDGTDFGNATPEQIEQELEERSYRARKAIEQQFVDRGIGAYVNSLSGRHIIYKGLMRSDQVGRFYTDLQEPEYTARYAMVHSRFSTNTVSTWQGAHPYPGGVIHNGEINTIRGNQEQFLAYTNETGAEDFRFIPGLSDSGRFDAAVNHLTQYYRSGEEDKRVSLPRAMLYLMPPAWQHDETLSPEVRAMFEYWSLEQPPFDGPAHMMATDGRFVVVHLDRGGFRPSRYTDTDGLFIAGSEEGLVEVDEADVIKRGRLGAGEAMVLDMQTGKVWEHAELLEALAQEMNYPALLQDRKRTIERPAAEHYQPVLTGAELVDQAKVYGWHDEILNLFVGPMLAEGKELVIAMGDDTPFPAMSKLPWDISYYFKQRFAQVTNPPIDSAREGSIMSLQVALGAKPSVSEAGKQVVVESPMLRPGELQAIRAAGDVSATALSLAFNAGGGKKAMEAALEKLKRDAVAAAQAGNGLIVLSDKTLKANQAAIPAPLAVAAVHEALRDAGQRLHTSLIAETGQVTNPHQAALLLGMGASAIDAFMLSDAAVHMWQENQKKRQPKWFSYDPDRTNSGKMADDVAGMSRETAIANVYQAMDSGIKKIMSKMGINDVESYIGGKQFEAVGLDLDEAREPVLAHAFRGVSSQIAGHGLSDLAENQAGYRAHQQATAGNGELDMFGKHASLRSDTTEDHAFAKSVSGMLNEYAENLLGDRLRDVVRPALRALLGRNATPDATAIVAAANTAMVKEGLAVGFAKFPVHLAPLLDELGIAFPDRDKQIRLTFKSVYEGALLEVKRLTEGYIAQTAAPSPRALVEAVNAALATYGAVLNTGEVADKIARFSGNTITEDDVLDVYEQLEIELERDHDSRWSKHDIDTYRANRHYATLSKELNEYGAGHPTALRDLLRIKAPANDAIDPSRVQSASDIIASAFTTGAMSDGALTRLAHSAITVGMNNIGGRSNTGEGGEKPSRWQSPTRNAKIKQAASGRFGLTAEYLASIPEGGEVEIKIAQGAKPGEGGQLPGGKVSVYIATNRGGVPGVELISPPPHHDIYSIEDLAQLIYDLKAANRRVGVKLVATEGIGTIAVGVAKALLTAGLDEDDLAGTISIAGNSGGTGAAPVTSAYHAGLPTELGLAEADKALRDAGLRDIIRLRASGTIKTADDVIKMAIMGADEFEFGTLAMNLIGCVMLKKCNIPGACSPGVANNAGAFKGEAAAVEEFFVGLAHEVREKLAAMGVENLHDLRGRTEFLEQADTKALGFRGHLDLGVLTEARTPITKLTERQIANLPKANDTRIDEMLADAIEHVTGGAHHDQSRLARVTDGIGKLFRRVVGDNALSRKLEQDNDALGDVAGGTRSAPVSRVRNNRHDPIGKVEIGRDEPIHLDNSNRSFGARLSVQAAKHIGSLHRGLQGSERSVVPLDAITVNLNGVAGQSFGVFNAHGVHLHLHGVAQDYLGKNMSGGILSLAAPDPQKQSDEQVIAGNVALYGASGGFAYINGQAGDRFAVRNSGATAVVEGVGDFAAEYMTSGTILNLGKVGKHFGVGMSGGVAYQYNPGGANFNEQEKGLEKRVKVHSLSERAYAEHEKAIHALLEQHVRHTGSGVARGILANWEQEKHHFRVVVPNAMQQVLDDPEKVESWTKVLRDKQTRRSIGEEFLRQGAVGRSAA